MTSSRKVAYKAAISALAIALGAACTNAFAVGALEHRDDLDLFLLRVKARREVVHALTQGV